jgi:hypothetical protein
LRFGGLEISDLVTLGRFLTEVATRTGADGLSAIGYLLTRAGLSSKPVDLTSLQNVTFRYRSVGSASSTLFEPTAAFPQERDEYQPAPGVPAPQTPELRMIDHFALEADRSVPVSFTTPLGDVTIPAWLRGIMVHVAFASLVSAAFGADHSEVSYVGHRETLYGFPGSVRADAVVGPLPRPTFAVELKTGNAYLTRAQARRYFENLPEGTLLT